MSSDSILEQADCFSSEGVAGLRSDLSALPRNDEVCVVVVGSYGRGEASSQSDLDFFVLERRKGAATPELVQAIQEAAKGRKIRMPSADGAFNSRVESLDEMLENIGGSDDTNHKLTRRMLFLLEGDWLYNEDIFRKTRQDLVYQYVRTTITEHQICRFFLNDVIRYYRTICVDFEHKTHEDGKPWGDRNIKLLFSRKLLYFSGVLAVAETYQNGFSVKRELLIKYLSMTPLKRIRYICGAAADKALGMYGRFLSDMANSDVRALLAATKEPRAEHSAEFREFKNRGHHFTLELSRLLNATYDGSHPIHVALKF